MGWKKLDLEVSLKPFHDLSDTGMAETGRTIIRQWRPLIDQAEQVSLMFWAADGSEIFDYNGNLEDTFEWAKWVGVANPHFSTQHPESHKGIHERPRLYMKNPPDWRYGDLKRLIAVLKREFAAETGKALRVGATFDSGPEFAISTFKYKRHPEICRGFCLGGKTFVCCYTTLHADNRSYAGFPQGIPEGTTLGTFLGRQAQHYLTDLGFDYLWLSNGFGFGMETWGATGAIFDGYDFTPEKAGEIRETLLRFWRDFRRECPTFPLESRGTNLSTGMDLTSDATPLREIYREVSDLEVPPNSPWAALDGDFGMELAGWMSHIAELPAEKGFPLRYYIHDIWFMNSPWLDRYGRSPHDIYLPLSIARLDEAGKPAGPNALHLLSIDDSLGRMPDQVPLEVIPHLLEAERTAPDQAGPLVWLYPFDEYHDLVYSGERLEEIFAGDYLIRGALNAGLPLNSVISGGNFLKSLAAGADYTGRIIVAPTVFTVNPTVMEALTTFLEHGGKVLFYGPARGKAIEQLLDLEEAPGLEGEFEISGVDSPLCRVRHLERYSGGALDRVCRADSKNRVLAWYNREMERRPAAVLRAPAEWNGGAAVWVRGTNSFSMEKDCHYSTPFDPATYYGCEALLRESLASFGYTIRFEKAVPRLRDPRLTLRWHDNALYMAGFGTDTTVVEKLRFPDGAPVFTGCDLILKENLAHYPAERAVNRECRIFVTGANAVIGCREAISLMPGVRRRIQVDNLRNARLVFRPEQHHVESVRFTPGGSDDKKLTLAVPSTWQATLVYDGFGPKYILENITGNLLISWGEEN